MKADNNQKKNNGKNKDNYFVKVITSPQLWSGVILVVLFGALIANICYFVANKSYDIISDHILNHPSIIPVRPF